MNKKDKQKEKHDRLAQALRDNLRRRKLQTPATPKTKVATDKVTDGEKE